MDLSVFRLAFGPLCRLFGSTIAGIASQHPPTEPDHS